MPADIVTTSIFTDSAQITSSILNGMISNAVIQPNAITTIKINDLAVTTGKIVDSAVTTGKIVDSAVTKAKLNSDITPSLVPAGAVMPFAMQTAPTGWLSANGQIVNRTTYASLFTAIGTLYGSGDGSTTFGLPDLQGRFVRGFGGLSAAFGSPQADDLLSHTHTLKMDACSATGGGEQTIQHHRVVNRLSHSHTHPP
jgi:hypothetical protein